MARKMMAVSWICERVALLLILFSPHEALAFSHIIRETSSLGQTVRRKLQSSAVRQPSPFGQTAHITAQPGLQGSVLHMSASNNKPRGSAATPLDKKAVAVFGAGGSLGGTIFGFLQRASNLYGTGIGGAAMPRNICACSEGSLRLNSILSKGFKLAYAGEQHMRLVDMSNVEHVAARLKGADAVVLGTICQLEPGRSVTANTYEKTPNDKTIEFFLDEKRGFGDEYAAQDAKEQLDVHLELFQTAIDACKLAGSIQHVVVLETPHTPSSEPFAKIMDNSGLKFTYIYTNASRGGGDSSTWTQSKDWTFEKGVVRKNGMNLETAVLGDDYMTKPGYEAGDWASSLPELTRGSADIFREDVAALAVQSMLSLDWDKCRVIGLSCLDQDGAENESANASKFRPSRPPKSDREWCMNSNIIADLLSVVD